MVEQPIEVDVQIAGRAVRALTRCDQKRGDPEVFPRSASSHPQAPRCERPAFCNRFLYRFIS